MGRDCEGMGSMMAEISTLAADALVARPDAKIVSLKSWLYQPNLYECTWGDRYTGPILDLRPPLPLASDHEWAGYRTEFLEPLLRRHPADALLQLHSELVSKLQASRAGHPASIRQWRSDAHPNKVTDPLEWYYEMVPSLAVQIEDATKDRRFWSLVHPRFSPPAMNGIWWSEFHPMSSNERWAKRRD